MSIRNWSASTKRMRTSVVAIGVAGAVALGSLAGGGAFAQPSNEQVLGTGTIVTAGQVGANCRAEPNVDAQFLTLVPDGQVVEVIGEAQNDFLPVICNDQNGWIFAPLVTNYVPATPMASPETATTEPTATMEPTTATVATPEAVVPAWIDTYAIDPATTVSGDSVTVGVKLGDALEINAPSFESRPFVTLQTTNDTDEDATFVLFSAPEGTDATTFAIPEEESALPEGVTPVASYSVAPGETFGAVLPELADGTYVLATTTGKALTFDVQPASEIVVPDIFASPSATTAPTESPTTEPTATTVPTKEPTATTAPTKEPTATTEPTEVPTKEPTATTVPTETPTTEPTATTVPTETPTTEPTATETAVPTETPTTEPTATETAVPTETPTTEPTATETAEPTATSVPATPVPSPTTEPTATDVPATPVTSPIVTADAASPAAVVPAWLGNYALDSNTTADGDSTSVGVTVGDALEINAPAFETRPYVILQTTNATESEANLALFSAPEGTDATGFTIPEDESALPAGVTPYASYDVAPGETYGAVLKDLPAGTYILADANGQALSFTVDPQTEIDVPDIFASPESTVATPATTTEASPASVATTDAATASSPIASPVSAVPAWVATYAVDPQAKADGDSTSVGVTVGDALEINAPAFETRPYVILQTMNATENEATLVLFSAPEGTDATGFTIPADESALPTGVTPYASYTVQPGETFGAILPNLPAGTYILADSNGQAITFTVTPETAIDVPDIFASPESTPSA